MSEGLDTVKILPWVFSITLKGTVFGRSQKVGEFLAPPCRHIGNYATPHFGMKKTCVAYLHNTSHATEVKKESKKIFTQAKLETSSLSLAGGGVGC